MPIAAFGASRYTIGVVLITAVIIGLLTAYYFGVRMGAFAAVGSAVLLVAALVLPGFSWQLYGLLAVFVVGVCLAGPKLGKSMPLGDVLRRSRQLTGWASKWLGKLRR